MMEVMRALAAIAVLLWALPAGARASRSIACIDSFGTVIEGVGSPGACKKLGARWGKPGSKSLPKEAKEPRASKESKHASKAGRHHRASAEADHVAPPVSYSE